MAKITFDRFDLGIDLRKSASVSDANRLREMKNAYVTTGLATAKRPGLTKVATLPSGSKGLFSAFGKLQVFSNTLPHPTLPGYDTSLINWNELQDGLGAVKDVWFCDTFNGYLYVAIEYADGTIKHHYLNGGLKTAISDSNCPHTKAVVKAASKIFAVSADGQTVRYSATGKCTDWTTAEDAGFLPTGLNARGDRETNALALYRTYLVALSRDGAQVWTVNADPSAMSLSDRVDNVGTAYPRTVVGVSGETYFLSDYGFRSIAQQVYLDSLTDVDVGSPIDSLVRQTLRTMPAGTVPRAFYFYGTGQYVCCFGNHLYVYSQSKTSKIAAWSEYFLSVEVEAVAQLGQTLYLRSGDTVYKLDDEATTDDGEQFEVLITLPYLNFKRPGSMKHIYGLDAVVDGSCEISVGWDPRDPSAYTPEVKVSGNTRPGGMIPVECSGTDISIRVRNFDDKPFQLNALTLYYEDEGEV